MYDAAKAAREFAAKWVGDADAAFSAMCGSYDCPKHEPAYVAVVRDAEAKLRAAHAAGYEEGKVDGIPYCGQGDHFYIDHPFGARCIRCEKPMGDDHA